MVTTAHSGQDAVAAVRWSVRIGPTARDVWINDDARRGRGAVENEQERVVHVEKIVPRVANDAVDHGRPTAEIGKVKRVAARHHPRDGGVGARSKHDPGYIASKVG